MREILFRGKCIYNGEWVYGDLIHTLGGNPLICTKHVFGAPAEVFEVDYATVGQYTGLDDKNGKKIFEGDYLKTRALTGEVYVQEVRWTNKFNIVGFRMVDSDEYWDDFDDYEGRIEVVGNIHDDDIEKIKEEVYNA
jgi:uncharacterized phage protein (TIGR01671 family)